MSVVRTREQQRRATVRALLDATVDSLVEVGFAATTTRAVAVRAGVSQGALQHHFSSKAALVDAAINHAFDKVAADISGEPLAAGSEVDRASEILDRLWDVHQGPLFAVVYELLVLARTHADTADLTARTATPLVEATREFAAEALPDHAQQDGFGEWVLAALAAMRGAAMVAAIPGAAASAPGWPALRGMLLAGLPEAT